MSHTNGQERKLAVVGDGHLARLVTILARDLKLSARTLSPVDLGDIIRDPTNAAARAKAMLHDANTVILATEHCPADALRQLAKHATVVPSPDLVAITQDRGEEREWLERRGLHTTAWRRVTGAQQLLEVLREFGGEAFIKPCRRSEESGRPIYVRRAEHAVQAWRQLGSVPVIVEEVATVELELAVLVARGKAGELAVYPPVMSQRQSTELRWSVTPAPVPAEIAERAQSMGRRVAEGLELVGVATLEVFWLSDGRLAANEIVLGPHLAHAADAAAFRTGQCEQLVRIATGQPVAPVTSLRPAASAPITGAMWSAGHVPDFERLRSMPGVQVSFYGGRAPQRDRILGHLSALGNTPEEAVSLLLSAQRLAAADADRGRVNRTASAGPATKFVAPRDE